MAIRIIRTGNDPVLRDKAKPVPKINKAIEKLLDDMAQTMYDADGIGLAANQIGIAKQIVVADVGDGLFELINPEIIERSEETDAAHEACLSLPGLRGVVTRPSRIRFRYTDRNGNEKELEAGELFARCIQHEIDHLHGILFTDYLKPNEVERVQEKESQGR
ncbi:peptide deformylase [Alicyclobacillus sp. SO9]|uniref:peptide deformylase n=1 Tax=Alicyclobacillus sp. SO9 TaxID=2665646 RepID=UPI0018E7526F|nr:peptide deformylase [Alicyclobacillus sp. SO9]QQE80736.1 peptide deformylase [Alicyclobacillus sp. SO9]